MENIEQKNPLLESATEGLFAGLHSGEKMTNIRENIRQNNTLNQYYELVKSHLIKESGLNSIHRTHILNKMYEILSTGGNIEKGLAEQLEKLSKI